MREIKFRVWDGMRMNYNPFVSDAQESGGNLHWVINELGSNLMQYTGLKDKYGLEIYEGDIVKSITLEDQLWDANDFKNYEIKFKGGSFCFYSENGQRARQWNDGYQDWYSIENTETFDIEVLGNIYENPKLLK